MTHHETSDTARLEPGAVFTRAIERAAMSVGVAESMTGGALAEALVVIPGSGEWLAGGVIAYMTRVKREVLGVDPGPVISDAAARQMAQGVARVLGTDVGISTTGCAGPEEMEGEPVRDRSDRRRSAGVTTAWRRRRPHPARPGRRARAST